MTRLVPRELARAAQVSRAQQLPGPLGAVSSMLPQLELVPRGLVTRAVQSRVVRDWRAPQELVQRLPGLVMRAARSPAVRD